MEVVKLINGPEAFTPGQRVLPRRDRGARASCRPPASAPTASPAPAGSASWWPSGSWTATPCSTSGTWTRAASAAPTARPATRSHARSRSTRPTTTSRIRPRAAGRAAAAASRPPTRWHASTARRSARSPAGSGPTGSSRTRRAATSRCARAAGRAGTGRRRSGPSTWPRRETAGALRRVLLREDRGLRRPGAAELLERLCDNRVARDVGAITYTQMLNTPRRHRVRLHRDALGEDALPHRHRHRLRPARPRLDPRATARDGSVVRHRRDRALRLLRRCGARPRARSCAADADRARLPATCACARSRSATSRCARCA